jgi:glycosyltransferase involved in cell wall biosynthesis
MNTPLVTVVTPSFNQATFLRHTIESVLSQDYPHLEYVIMDGASTDGSARIAAEYGSRLTWISEPDRGQTHAINKGFQRARGEIVAWLNSDDTLLPGAVSAAVEAFRTAPAAGAVYGGGYCIDRDGAVTMKFPFTEDFNLWRLTWLCDYILQQAAFFRRDAVAEVGWLDESLHWAMDWDLLTRLGKRFGLRHVPVEMGCLREYGETKTASGGRRRFQELRTLLRRQTGALWPPGCWYYGLDTYDKIWGGAFRRFGADSLAERIVHLCRRKIDVTALHSQGYYPGGWAGARLHWMLPQGTVRARIAGEVELSGGQALRLIQAGREVSRHRVDGGSFEWEVDTLHDGRNGAVTFQVLAQRTVRGPEGWPRAWKVCQIERA